MRTRWPRLIAPSAGRFERFDEAGGIATADDIADPGTQVAATAEFHDARFVGRDARILPQQFPRAPRRRK